MDEVCRPVVSKLRLGLVPSDATHKAGLSVHANRMTSAKGIKEVMEFRFLCSI